MMQDFAWIVFHLLSVKSWFPVWERLVKGWRVWMDGFIGFYLTNFNWSNATSSTCHMLMQLHIPVSMPHILWETLWRRSVFLWHHLCLVKSILRLYRHVGIVLLDLRRDCDSGQTGPLSGFVLTPTLVEIGAPSGCRVPCVTSAVGAHRLCLHLLWPAVNHSPRRWERLCLSAVFESLGPLCLESAGPQGSQGMWPFLCLHNHAGRPGNGPLGSRQTWLLCNLCSVGFDEVMRRWLVWGGGWMAMLKYERWQPLIYFFLIQFQVFAKTGVWAKDSQIKEFVILFSCQITQIY